MRTAGKDGRAIVVDPGRMTPEPDALAAAEAVLITHEHFDPERLHGTRSEIYTCAGVARHLGGFGERVHVVREGDGFSAAGFDVVVAGEKHHFSHPDVPPADNVGFLIDGEVFHPGDALTEVEVPTLLVPGQAPWLTVPDMIDYCAGGRRAVRTPCTTGSSTSGGCRSWTASSPWKPSGQGLRSGGCTSERASNCRRWLTPPRHARSM